MAQALLNSYLFNKNTSYKNNMVITRYNFKFAALKCSAYTKNLL
jgi:hypothetical protein